MEQKHYNKGDNVQGSKIINNRLVLKPKAWIIIILTIFFLTFVFFAKKREVVGIKGDNNSNNNIHITND